MKNLFKSLADFQQEVPTILKDTKGFGYNYADLPAVLKVINPLMQKHGLGFTQLLNGSNLITMIFHVESGEILESKTTIPLVALKGMNEYQSFGSGITYYRRYALSSILGIVTDKDTDASGEQENKNSVKTAKPKEKLSDERFNKARESICTGDFTKTELIEKFDLTAEQIKIIEKL